MIEREWQSQMVANSCAEAAEIVARREVSYDKLIADPFLNGAPAAWARWFKECDVRVPPDRALERDRPAYRVKLDESFGVDPKLGHDVIGCYNEETKSWSFVKLPTEKS